jgi:hypothetical protein
MEMVCIEPVVNQRSQTPMLCDVWYTIARTSQGVEQASEEYEYLTTRVVELFGEL